MDRFCWVSEHSLNTGISVSYKPIGIKYTQTLYLNFHYPVYDVLYTKKPKNKNKFKNITIISDNIGLNSIYVSGTLKIKVLLWHFKDKFFENMSDYSANNRNNKLKKVVSFKKD